MDKTMIEIRPNISIIVPVYNVEKYLVRCLDSIFHQQFSGTFEVITIEDASTDNSLQVLKSYQVNERRLIIIEHEVNKKVSVARATGLKASKGDYIMCVDSDDWLLPFALESLYLKCLESDADVLVFNHVEENNSGKITYVRNINKELITNDKLKIQHHFYKTPWNKIFKRLIADNLINGEVGINITEDLLYATEVLLKAKKICLLPEYYYVYVVNAESLTRNIKPVELLEIQIIILEQIKLITNKYEATSQFTNNILSYLEKDIFLAISQAAFLVKGQRIKNTGLLNAFRLFPEMTENRLNRLASAMSNKYYSLVQVFLRFGVKPVLGIILRSIRKQFYNIKF